MVGRNLQRIYPKQDQLLLGRHISRRETKIPGLLTCQGALSAISLMLVLMKTVHLQYRRQSCRPISVLVLTILTISTYKCMTLPAITWHCYSQLLPRFLEMVGTMPRNFINQFLYVDSGETVTHVDSIQMSTVRVGDPQHEESLFMTELRAPTWYKFGAHAHPHQVASSEAHDVLHRVMRPTFHHHICMAIQIAIDLPGIFVVVNLLLAHNVS